MSGDTLNGMEDGMNKVNEPVGLAFLHGGGQGSWVWDQTIAALCAQDPTFDKVLALDIPGCGVKRGREIAHLSPLDVAHELISDLEEAGMKHLVLAGHSLAGNVMPRLAQLRPDLFRRLIYISCSVPLPGQTVLQLMGNGPHGSNDNEVGWPADSKRAAMRDRYEALFCEDMTPPQKESFLPNLVHDNWPPQFFSATNFTFDNLGVVPATYVVCLKDRVLPVVWQEKFAARFHAERLVRIDAGHQVMVSRPHALAEVLRLEAQAV
jgi:pimeloyl-ACP methyl ester carboxylesterase